MKAAIYLLAPLAVLALALPARADVQVGGASVSGEMEAGYRSVAGDFNSAKFYEYRDPGPGFLGQGHFTIEGASKRLYLLGRFRQISRQDQEYHLEGGVYGRGRLQLGFSQLPHVFSFEAASPFTDVSNGPGAFLALPFARPPVPDLATAVGGALYRPRLQFRQRDIYADLAMRPTEEMEVGAGWYRIDKQGTRNRAVNFGFSGFNQVAAPLDENTNLFHADLRRLQDDWTVGLGYRGSVFQNEFDSITIDNPLVGTDVAGSAGSRGRIATAPDNSEHRVHVEGSKVLPLSFPAQVAGTFGWGSRRQDEDFLPHTINTSIVSPALPQSDLKGRVNTWLANLNLTARPNPNLRLKARYRFYDYDPQTDDILFTSRVAADTGTVTAGTFLAMPNDYRRQNVTAEASWRMARSATVVLGYGFENWQRNQEREVSRLSENSGRLRLNLRPSNRFQVRAGYLFGSRNGNSYQTPPGELSRLRQFNLADRQRNEADLSATWLATERLDVTLRGDYRNHDYLNSEYGLRNWSLWDAAVELGYQISESVRVSAHYTYEWTEAKQKSRSGGDAAAPTQDWTSDSTDWAHNVGGALDWIVLPERLDARFSAEYQDGRAQTHSSGFNAVDYPSLRDTLQVYAATLTYRVSERLRVRGGYRYEFFNGRDFTNDSLVPVIGNDLYLLDRFRDYSAHVLSGSVILSF